MSAIAYYNEIDPAAAHILCALIDEGVIAPGHVDTRSIKDVMPDDLAGYTQCHFFAGGGLWSVAARLAGWPDDAPIWTGSCPCQPFSAAGKGLGTDDPRHLWPDFHRLIGACRPPVVMGEQVAGKAGYGWFDGVRSDLARENYTSRAVDFPACSIDAPHQRNRLYWVAVDDHDGFGRTEAVREPSNDEEPVGGRQASGTECAHSCDGRTPPNPARAFVQGQPAARHEPNAGKDEGVYADTAGAGRISAAQAGIHRQAQSERAWDGKPQRPALPKRPNRTYWSDAIWIECHDGKVRRAEPGIRFLVDGLPGRVDLWRVGGNAIVPEAAAQVIAAFIETHGLPVDERAAA